MLPEHFVMIIDNPDTFKASREHLLKTIVHPKIIQHSCIGESEVKRINFAPTVLDC